MTDRRAYPRFVVATPWEGEVRVLRDVVIQRVGPDEILAISLAPGRIDEEMSLNVVGGGASVDLRVRVIESAPIIVNGGVRHRIRLSVVGLVPATADELLVKGGVTAVADAVER